MSKNTYRIISGREAILVISNQTAEKITNQTEMDAYQKVVNNIKDNGMTGFQCRVVADKQNNKTAFHLKPICDKTIFVTQVGTTSQTFPNRTISKKVFWIVDISKVTPARMNVHLGTLRAKVARNSKNANAEAQRYIQDVQKRINTSLRESADRWYRS